MMPAPGAKRRILFPQAKQRLLKLCQGQGDVKVASGLPGFPRPAGLTLWRSQRSQGDGGCGVGNLEGLAVEDERGTVGDREGL